MAARSRTERLVRRLQELQMNTPDVEATAVVSVDGLTMASSLPAGVEEDRVAAMSAAMLSLGERIASELGRGVLDEVLARQQTKLGLLFLDMRRASDDLAAILEA
jgi:predicted regulator of Ras-like GTPase activity (Roadblock/LC7/MglB family)